MSLELRAPHNERLSLELPVEAARLGTPFNGSLCAEDGRLFSIDRNIVQLVENKRTVDTLAQLSNHVPVTAQVYEDLWRRRSIGLLSGEDFSLEEEKKLLLELNTFRKQNQIMEQIFFGLPHQMHLKF